MKFQVQGVEVCFCLLFCLEWFLLARPDDRNSAVEETEMGTGIGFKLEKANEISNYSSNTW